MFVLINLLMKSLLDIAHSYDYEAIPACLVVWQHILLFYQEYSEACQEGQYCNITPHLHPYNTATTLIASL